MKCSTGAPSLSRPHGGVPTVLPLNHLAVGLSVAFQSDSAKTTSTTINVLNREPPEFPGVCQTEATKSHCGLHGSTRLPLVEQTNSCLCPRRKWGAISQGTAAAEGNPSTLCLSCCTESECRPCVLKGSKSFPWLLSCRGPALKGTSLDSRGEAVAA